MSNGVHITKRSPKGWAVIRAGADSASSVHETQAEAVAAARRLALKSGGAEIVIHRADGRIRDRDTVGAAKIDELKQVGGSSKRRATSSQASRRKGAAAKPARSVSRSGKPSGTTRAPRTEGPRTTLRVPKSLAHVADQLARELEVSRNDALLRLATRGARLYEQEQSIAERRDERWAAVVPGIVDIDQAEFPSPDEAREALLAARETLAEPAS